MIVAIDVETTGLPPENHPPNDPEGWPRMIQFGAVSSDKDGKVAERWECVVRPARWEVENTAVDVHGITTEYAKKNGRNQVAVCNEIERMVRDADIVIGHNINFDYWTCRHELMGCFRMFQWPKMVCTMAMAEEQYGTRIGLGDLHLQLFGCPPLGPHGALRDAEAALRCYLVMSRDSMSK